MLGSSCSCVWVGRHCMCFKATWEGYNLPPTYASNEIKPLEMQSTTRPHSIRSNKIMYESAADCQNALPIPEPAAEAANPRKNDETCGNETGLDIVEILRDGFIQQRYPTADAQNTDPPHILSTSFHYWLKTLRAPFQSIGRAVGSDTSSPVSSSCRFDISANLNLPGRTACASLNIYGWMNDFEKTKTSENEFASYLYRSGFWPTIHYESVCGTGDTSDFSFWSSITH